MGENWERGIIVFRRILGLKFNFLKIEIDFFEFILLMVKC